MTTVISPLSPPSAITGLRVEHLAKAYPTPTEPLVVLRDVSFELAPGQSLAVIGPSGSGKSTLLHILGTLDRPTSGTVRYGDIEPWTLPAAGLAAFRARHIGLVFQDHHLLPQCTALENVLLARLAQGRVRGEDHARGRALLAAVGLAQRERHLPAELSGGERQRVAIARALLNGPALLLCDEPTGNVDARAAADIGRMLAELVAMGKTMLITVTHSAELAAMFQRRLRMYEGRLIEA